MMMLFLSDWDWISCHVEKSLGAFFLIIVLISCIDWYALDMKPDKNVTLLPQAIQQQPGGAGEPCKLSFASHITP